MIGKHFDDLVAAEDAPTLRPIFEAGFAGRTTTLEFFSRLTQVDNLLDIVPINDVPNTTGTEILVLAHDIGPIKQRERALAQAEARWRTAFEVAPVGMAQLGLDGRFSRVNPALCEMIGYPAEQLLTMTPADICHPDEAGVVGQAILDVAAGRVERLSTETRYVHADGHILWCAINAVPVHDDDGRVDHFLAHCLDITARKQMETELQQLSVRDPLTGLLNRRGFDDALLRQIAHVDRYGPDGALLILDLDGLKRLNDTQGHDAGDHALVATADLLRRRLRATDTLARLGGDEFAIILSHVDRLQANTTADSIVRTIRQHGTTHPTTYPITASIGVALFTTDGARDVVARADAAMYIAKRAGRDQVAMSGPDPQLAQAGGKPRDH
jgi:diguanylate cyclase (GGDEF)-like protein/PAS domain S-box-containing protein